MLSIVLGRGSLNGKLVLLRTHSLKLSLGPLPWSNPHLRPGGCPAMRRNAHLLLRDPRPSISSSRRRSHTQKAGAESGAATFHQAGGQGESPRPAAQSSLSSSRTEATRTRLGPERPPPRHLLAPSSGSPAKTGSSLPETRESALEVYGGRSTSPRDRPQPALGHGAPGRPEAPTPAPRGVPQTARPRPASSSPEEADRAPGAGNCTALAGLLPPGPCGSTAAAPARKATLRRQDSPSGPRHRKGKWHSSAWSPPLASR